MEDDRTCSCCENVRFDWVRIWTRGCFVSYIITMISSVIVRAHANTNTWRIDREQTCYLSKGLIHTLKVLGIRLHHKQPNSRWPAYSGKYNYLHLEWWKIRGEEPDWTLWWYIGDIFRKDGVDNNQVSVYKLGVKHRRRACFQSNRQFQVQPMQCCSISNIQYKGGPHTPSYLTKASYFLTINVKCVSEGRDDARRCPGVGYSWSYLIVNFWIGVVERAKKLQSIGSSWEQYPSEITSYSGRPGMRYGR